MDTKSRIESALEKAVARACGTKAPPRIAEALRHAVFPGGARIRPRLCHAVAAACGDDAPAVTDGAAAALELLHCASLVHDDMPCFDDASLRRGRPSVHALYGEPLALLVGDGLIVLAFETIALESVQAPARMAQLISAVAHAVGMPHGIVAGQAWEAEERIDLETYHRAKTGSLFVGSAMAGALAAGADPPTRGACSATGWARPTRWPTTCVIRWAARPRSASRRARTPPTCGRMPCRGWGRPEPSIICASLSAVPSRPSRRARGPANSRP